MKLIRLNTPAADNGGARREAGEALAIGSGAGGITLARAQALVTAGSANDVTPAEKPTKAKADK